MYFYILSIVVLWLSGSVTLAVSISLSFYLRTHILLFLLRSVPLGRRLFDSGTDITTLKTIIQH